MPYIRNVFTGGKMSKDVDERLLKKGEYRTALNIRIANSEGSNVGAIEKSLSNRQITNLFMGENVKTIGGIANEFNERLYWLTKSDNGCYIVEHDTVRNITSFVLKDTRPKKNNVLNFDEKHLVTGIVLIVDTDNDNYFLIFTDNKTQPKCINIERAKSYPENGFDEEMILLIKKPPIDAPQIKLGNTGTGEENNIEEKFLRFGYRYKYLDGEYSAISPLSTIAFKPKRFRYNFATSTNESMVNAFNKVDITINTGRELITDVEIVFIEGEKNIPYLVDTFNKKDKGWADNTDYTVSFSNNKIYRNLPEKQLFRLYDNVPLKAKALEIINSRIVFGNYTENYDLIDANGNKVVVDLKLSYDQADRKPRGVSYPTCKSNRDLEVAIAYVDEYGRMTTPLVSENNTTYIQPKHCDRQNFLTLSIKNNPPKWAKYYRVFIKQSKKGFDVISPNNIREDGVFRWIQVLNKDFDKVKEGDFLIVKADTEKIITDLQKVRVLEINKEKKEFKIKTNLISLNSDDYKEINSEYMHYIDSRYYDAIEQYNPEISDIHYYGDEKDDVSVSGICTLPPYTQKRYLIQIDQKGNGTTTFDTFKWSDTNGEKWNEEKVEITPNTAQELNNGVKITFQSNTGHSKNDQWNVNAIGVYRRNYPHAFAYGFFRIGEQEDHGLLESKEDEKIYGGSEITLRLKFCHGNWEIKKTAQATYDNIQEWYWKEKIYKLFHEKDGDFQFDGAGNPNGRNNIFFIRGRVTRFRGKNPTCIFQDGRGFTTMIVSIQAHNFPYAECQVFSNMTYKALKSKQRIIFETQPKEENSDIFYEIGRTYKIENGKHLGYDSEDFVEGSFISNALIKKEVSGFPVSSTNPIQIALLNVMFTLLSVKYNLPLQTIKGIANGTITEDIVIVKKRDLKLPFYNAYGWGNGFESIKIRDMFNANTLSIHTRPSVPVQGYRKNTRIASLTYGKQYDQSLNYNGLNEFNMSELNFKDLDDKYGSIQRIMTYNTDLDVWQEDKTHKVMYGKSTLYNQDGSANVGKSSLILDTVIPYAGEYGISTHPESLASWGNYRYWTDARRGVVLRKGQSGIEVISKYGMKDWFRDFMRKNYRKPIFGAIDPYYGQYTLRLEEDDTPSIPIFNCGNDISKFKTSEPFIYILQLNDLTGTITFPYNITEGAVTIQAEFNGEIHKKENVSGAGNLTFNRSNLVKNQVTVRIKPIGETASYSIGNMCPVGEQIKIVHVIVSNKNDIDTSIVNRYVWGKKTESYTPTLYKENINFTNDFVIIREYQGVAGKGRFPLSGKKISIQSYRDESTDGRFNLDLGDRLGYFVSDTVFDKSNINSLLSQATYPKVSTIYGFDDEVNFIVFDYQKTGDILYLIWDYSHENKPPVAIDDVVSVDEDESVVITILANDTDVDGDTLTPRIVSLPDHGEVTLNADKTVTYKHNGSQHFKDSFTYKINDGREDSNIATVTINVIENKPPVAVNDTANTTQGESVTIPVLANDNDPEGASLTPIIVTQPTYGTVTINTNKTIKYKHNGSVHFSDSFTYKVNDGKKDSNIATVRLTITENPYVLITTTSKSSQFGGDFTNEYVTVTGGVNKPRYKSSQKIDLSTNTGSAVVKVENKNSYNIPALNITSLNVTKNPNLTNLVCYNNQLTSLNVTKNTSLEYLNCYKNQLTTLGVTKNTSLKDLRCGKNQLTALDVSKNTSLTHLGCLDNQLTTLDVTKNTSLKDLRCGKNQLTALDVSKNTNLTYLRCKNNPNLTTVYVSATQKQKLDNNQLPNWQKDTHTNYVIKP